MESTIELPALRRAADLLPATINEQDRSIEVVWSTGARVRRQPNGSRPPDRPRPGPRKSQKESSRLRARLQAHLQAD